MVLITGIVFSLLLVTISYSINRRLLGKQLVVDGYQLALTASCVVVLALVGESLINPLYTALFGQKLWVYRILPLHDGSVSALGVLVWAAYGIHLYFTRQTLINKLPHGLNNTAGIAIIIGFEAPLICEVLGNLLFLQLLGEYYAYYLPGDVFHLTSLQVVPIYMLCLFIGLTILGALESLPRKLVLPPALFSAGVVYLVAG
jgi:hypothetical protein